MVFRRVVKLFVTSALACALALLATAAPALSRPYRPDPVQFSMPAAGEGALMGSAARRGEGVVSEPLRAAKRFNMVALTWSDGNEEPGIAIRTRRAGGAWSRWATVYRHAEDAPDPGAEPAVRGSAPTWAGEADWVQYRLTERLRGLRLNFVNVRGTATAAARTRTAVGRVASAGLATLAGAVEATPARARQGRPSIVSRAAWGASKCPPRERPAYGEVEAAFVHHTVNANDYTREEAPDVVLAICLFHRNTNGWADVGYNFLVDRFGTIYEGRAGGAEQAVVGAQAQGYNAQSTGIANLGTFTSVRQSPEAIRAVARVIRWKLPLHGKPTTGPVTLTSTGGASNRFPAGRGVRLQRVIGHRDTGATSCPGEALYAQLPEIRRLVAGAVPPGALTQLEARPDSRRPVRFGSPAPVGGRLTNEAGSPLAGLPVEVQARIGRRWRTLSTLATGLQGEFAALVKPHRNRSLRVRFEGSGDLMASTSPSFLVAVAPLLTIDEPPTAGRVGARAVLSGAVRPRKALVYQVLQVRRAGRFRNVGVTALRVGRNGRFRGSFVPAASGTYRYQVVARADRITVRGASPRYTLRVTGRRR